MNTAHTHLLAAVLALGAVYAAVLVTAAGAVVAAHVQARRRRQARLELIRSYTREAL